MVVGQAIEGAVHGQLFGKQCFKIGGKPFVAFFKASMIFKLEGVAHAEALALAGATLFDPSGKQRPMKEWVQVPFDRADLWPAFAAAAKQYVEGLAG